MWTFTQCNGVLRGSIIATGYSGKGEGKNNPAMQNIEGIGPIPCGFYTIELIVDGEGNAIDYGDKKAPVFRLIPDAMNVMFDRSGFLLHGDNATHTASDGCMIQDHSTRVAVEQNSDKRLQVLSGLDSGDLNLQES